MGSKCWSLWNTAYLNREHNDITCNTLLSTDPIWAEQSEGKSDELNSINVGAGQRSLPRPMIANRSASWKSMMHRSVTSGEPMQGGWKPSASGCRQMPGRGSSMGCLQVVSICQPEWSTCEISRSVKTNRGSSCGAGRGLGNVHLLMYRRSQTVGEEAEEEQEDGKREDPDPANVHIPANYRKGLTT